MKPELVVDSKCIIGEGPVWDSDTGKLYFIDILDSGVYPSIYIAQVSIKIIGKGLLSLSVFLY